MGYDESFMNKIRIHISILINRFTVNQSENREFVPNLCGPSKSNFRRFFRRLYVIREIDFRIRIFLRGTLCREKNVSFG